jgi:hypothetical protein
VLHRFESVIQPVTVEAGLRVTHAVGESAGVFTSRWLFGPDNLTWALDREPPQTAFDARRSQRFAMHNTRFTFADVEDSFRGYGIGRTFPITVAGQPRLLAGGVGTILEGVGKFQGLRGTFVLQGTLTPTLGFLGSITIRAIDPDGVIAIESEIPPLTPIPDPMPDETFIFLRGVKRDKAQHTEYIFAPDGTPVGLDTPAQMRSAQYSFTTQGYKGLRSSITVGQVIGRVSAKIAFSPTAPSGTETVPVPFATTNDYTFLDRAGRVIGTVRAIVAEGSGAVFDLKFAGAPRQPAIRFGGIGPIQEGTGQFSGVQGTLAVNSAVGRGPHALSLLQMLRIIDPDHKFRAAISRTR